MPEPKHGRVTAATRLRQAWFLQPERSRTEQTSRRARLLSEVFDQSPVAIAVGRWPDGRLIEVNTAFLRTVERSRHDVLGRTPQELGLWRPPAGDGDGASTGNTVEPEGVQRFECRLLARDGEVREQVVLVRRVRLNGYALVVDVMSDITEHKQLEAVLKAAEDDMRRLAFLDPLTRLPNRRLLDDRLSQAMASSARSQRYGAIVFVDLDNFKQLNDTRGHHAGDELLVSLARRLQSAVREQDTVARLGGDEFVVLLEELSDELAHARAEAERVVGKLFERLHEPHLLSGTHYACTGSMGVALFLGHRESPDALLRRADAAMYAAKSGGKGGARFAED